MEKAILLVNIHAYASPLIASKLRKPCRFAYLSIITDYTYFVNLFFEKSFEIEYNRFVGLKLYYPLIKKDKRL